MSDFLCCLLDRNGIIVYRQAVEVADLSHAISASLELTNNLSNISPDQIEIWQTGRRVYPSAFDACL